MTDARLLRSIRAATDVMRRASIDLRLELAMDRLQRLLREPSLEHRYNPDWRSQPRVPRGDPDGGQWTGGPGGAVRPDDRPVPSDAVTRDGRRPARRLAPAMPAPTEPVGLTDPRVISDANPDNDWEPGALYAQARPPRGARGGGVYRFGSRLVEPTPAEALRYELSLAQRNFAVARVRDLEPGWRPTPGLMSNTIGGQTRHNEAVTKEAIARYEQIQSWRWDPEILDLLGRAAEPTVEPVVPPDRPATTRETNVVVKTLSRFLSDPATFETVDAILGAGSWLFDFRHYVTAYLQPPRTLDELRAAGRQPQPGFDRHHLVEKASAREDDFPESWIEGEDNILGIPTLKHWRVTGWFMTPNEDYGGFSPRAYLRDKSWDERVEIGKRALEVTGVLKP